MYPLTLASVILGILVSLSTLVVVVHNFGKNRLAKKVADKLESEAVGELRGKVADLETRLIRIEMKIDRRR